MARLRAGGWAWLGLAAYVAICDAWLIKHRKASMSEVFGDALRHPAKRLPVVLVWGVLTLHLFAVFIPEHLRGRWKVYDPIGALARWIES